MSSVLLHCYVVSAQKFSSISYLLFWRDFVQMLFDSCVQTSWILCWVFVPNQIYCHMSSLHWTLTLSVWKLCGVLSHSAFGQTPISQIITTPHIQQYYSFTFFIPSLWSASSIQSKRARRHVIRRVPWAGLVAKIDAFFATHWFQKKEGILPSYLHFTIKTLV